VSGGRSGGARVLVVDDEPDIRGLLQEILEDEGYAVSVADSATAAQASVDESRPDLVLLDIWMPDTDGVTLLKRWNGGGGLRFPVIMISGHGTVETAVEATRHGAVDFIEKPVSLARLLLTVEKALANDHRPGNRTGEPDGEREALPPPRRLPLFVGTGERVQALRERLEEEGGRDGSLLLIGEGGSGRTLFAQHLHDRGRGEGGARPFIQLRCDTLSSASAHRELHGDEHGGSPSAGYFESAADGTLFLSDVELLPPAARQCLRQAIEEQGFVRHGGTTRVPLRCRLVASSRAPLVATGRGEPASGGGRRGLDPALVRLLSGSVVTLPPLREHPEDIPALLDALVDWHVAEEGLGYRHFTLAAQNRLRNLDWPGNLLELKNLVQRLMLLGGPTEIEVAEIDRALGLGGSANGGSGGAAAGSARSASRQAAGSGATITLRDDLPLREARADFERQYLLRCLSASGGNIVELARHVGMERTHLYRKLRSLDIDLDKVRE